MRPASLRTWPDQSRRRTFLALADVNKKERLAAERPAEQEQGLSPKRRGTPAAPSDKPENELPHPQDVNEISQRNRKG